jgi:hypothetical protein
VEIKDIPVSGAEGVVDVHFAVGGQRLREGAVVLLFAWVEPHVLKQGDAGRVRAKGRVRSSGGFVHHADALSEVA